MKIYFLMHNKYIKSFIYFSIIVFITTWQKLGRYFCHNINIGTNFLKLAALCFSLSHFKRWQSGSAL